MTDLIPIVIPAEVAVSQVEIPAEIGVAYSMVSGDWYDGPYEVDPAQETQVLETYGKLMSENVTVNPIPQNYGLITWDGSVLTVS